jgi:hypothetical protein
LLFVNLCFTINFWKFVKMFCFQNPKNWASYFVKDSKFNIWKGVCQITSQNNMNIPIQIFDVQNLAMHLVYHISKSPPLPHTCPTLGFLNPNLNGYLKMK